MKCEGAARSLLGAVDSRLGALRLLARLLFSADDGGLDVLDDRVSVVDGGVLGLLRLGRRSREHRLDDANGVVEKGRELGPGVGDDLRRLDRKRDVCLVSWVWEQGRRTGLGGLVLDVREGFLESVEDRLNGRLRVGGERLALRRDVGGERLELTEKRLNRLRGRRLVAGDLAKER